MNRQVAFCKILKKLQDLLWYKRSVMESFIGCFLVDFANSLLKQLFMNSRWWTFTLLFLSIWSQCSVPILHPPEKSENLNKKKWIFFWNFFKFLQGPSNSFKNIKARSFYSSGLCGQANTVKYSRGASIGLKRDMILFSWVKNIM